MKKLETVYIQDIIKQPFIDRWFYCFVNGIVNIGYDTTYLSPNPLKWSLITLFSSLFILFTWVVLIPLLGLPLSAYEAYKLPEKFKDDKWRGCFEEDIWVLRDFTIK